MKSRTLRFVGIAAVAALSVVALAQGINLKRTAKVGDTAKYRLRADVDIAGTTASFTAVLTEKILKVEDNGNFIVESAQSDGKVSFGDQEMAAPAQSPSVTVYKPTGEVVEIRGEMADSSAYRVANLGLFRFPDKELKVGEGWTHELAADSKTGTVPVKADYKIVAQEKVGDADTVKINFTVKETEGAEGATSTGHIWIDAKTGAMVKQEAEWKNAPFPGAPGPINAKVVISRI